MEDSVVSLMKMRFTTQTSKMGHLLRVNYPLRKENSFYLREMILFPMCKVIMSVNWPKKIRCGAQMDEQALREGMSPSSETGA